jgi:hypothetical protein
MKKDSSRYKKLDVNGYWFNNKTSNNLPRERWRPIPGLEETHEVSNYGRVRSLDKWIHPPGKNPYIREGHLMSPHPTMAANHFTKDFTYHVGISIQTKEGYFSFSIRRLVYHCFVEPIQLHDGHNPAYVILPKDGNGLNTHYKNLIKSSRQDKQKGLFENNRTVSSLTWLTQEQRRAMWEKGAHKIGQRIQQYDRTGQGIASFRSPGVASTTTGIRLSTICNAAKGRILTAGGYLWRYGKDTASIKIPVDYFTRAKDAYTARVSRPVTQYNLEGQRLTIYRSAKEAARMTGVAASNITACLHGRTLSAKGFIWKEGKGKKSIPVSKLAGRLWKSKKQSVSCYRNGKMIATYPSVNQAEKATDIPAYTIRKSAKDKTIKKIGLSWKFVLTV